LENTISESGAATMQNAMDYWGSGCFRDYNPYPSSRRVVDSGGYSAMNKYGGDFPWSVEEYDEYLTSVYRECGFDWAAVMDLACEEDFDDILSVEERQERTLENTIRHFNLDPEYPVIPVLQGREVNQWVEFHDRLQDHGIDTSYVGVGTLCRLQSPKQIAEVERALRTRTDVDAIHGFGVKISSFKHGAAFDTADSQAWSWKNQFGLKYVAVGDSPVRLETEEYGGADDAADAGAQSFDAYRRRAEWLQEQANSGATEQLSLRDSFDLYEQT